MKIGEIVIGAGGAVQCFQIRLQLDEISGDEPCGKTEMAQRLHQQPGGIATGPGAFLEGFFRCLYARLHANDIVDGLGDLGVQPDDEVDGSLAILRDRFQERGHARAGRVEAAVDLKIFTKFRRIVEGPFLRALLDEEIEGIVDGHVGDQIHFDLEFAHRFGKHEAGQPVAVGVLLVIDEVSFGRNLQRVRQDPGAAVWGRPQADNLRA